jgi:hypothetical protein
MRQQVIVGKHETPFVDVGTSDDMSEVSKKVAMMMKMIQAIRGIEDKMLSGQDKKATTMMDIAIFAEDSAELANEVIEISQRMKNKVSEYIKEL